MYKLLKNRLVSQVFLAILTFRMFMVFVVTSSFVPDEYWQGPEVAHKLVFGYGHYTWEWVTGLRSFLYPAFLSVPMGLLRYLGLDTRVALMSVPRIQQAVFTAIGDYYFLQYCKIKHSVGFARNVAFFYFSNWFLSYCGSRTLGNTMETSLNLIGLYLLAKKQLCFYVIVMVLNFIMRPSALVFWLPYIPFVLKQLFQQPKQLLSCSAAALAILAASLAVDTVSYGKITIPWWNFIDFNYIQGKSALFGTHPFHWYLTNCLILLCGGHYIAFIAAIVALLNRKEFKARWSSFRSKFDMVVSVVYIIIYSFLGHKELRFMLPIIPSMIMVSTEYLTAARRSKSSAIKRLSEAFTIIIVVVDIVTLVISSRFHLNGIPPATGFVSEQASVMKEPYIWVLMPCYSVPVYTQLHHPKAQIEFFTCPPPELNLTMPNLQLEDFSDVDLASFVANKTQARWPDFVMCFSTLVENIRVLLPNYQECFKAFNSLFPEGNVGDYVHVYCKSSRN